MKIVCVGGGPMGLYFATSMKLRNPDHDITMFEHNSVEVRSITWLRRSVRGRLYGLRQPSRRR